VFAFHDDVEIGPVMLAKIARQTGLSSRGPLACAAPLVAFAEGERADLTKAQRNQLREVLGRLAAEYRERLD
jgi:hypothetical protein